MTAAKAEEPESVERFGSACLSLIRHDAIDLPVKCHAGADARVNILHTRNPACIFPIDRIILGKIAKDETTW